MPDLASLHLPNRTRAYLIKAGFTSVSEVLLCPASVLLSHLRLSPHEVHQLVEICALHVAPLACGISPAQHPKCAFDDAGIDAFLSHIVRPGSVTELVGEAGTGKTTMSLQLALHSPGSAIFYSTEGTFPSGRLRDMAHASSLAHKLQSIHILATQTLRQQHAISLESSDSDFLEHVISHLIPTYIERLGDVKLVLIDSVAAAHRSQQTTQTSGMVRRAHDLNALSAQLRSLAITHNLAIVVLNQVNDVIAPPQHPNSSVISSSGEISYAHASKYFTGEIAANSNKSAALGLAWSQGINSRIALSRQLVYSDGDEDGKMERKANIVFSAYSPLLELPYRITDKGWESLSGPVLDNLRGDFDDQVKKQSKRSFNRIGSGSSDIFGLGATQEEDDAFWQQALDEIET